MSPSLPLISGKAAVQALEQAGFVPVSARGSHQKLRNPDGRVVIVPLHRELKRGTLASVLRQAGLSAEEFQALL